jgi:hypothetical protein
MVETNAIGRGTMAPTISLYVFAGPASDGLIVIQQA